MILRLGVELPVTRDDRDLAVELERKIHGQDWRVDHTETGYLTPFEAGMWGLLAEIALARRLGIAWSYELTGSHPDADLRIGVTRYEVRGTPWIKREEYAAGRWRTFVYPRETRDPNLIIARVDSFLTGARLYLTGWMWACDAVAYPRDPGRHLDRHAVPGFEPLLAPETMPGMSGAQVA
jgi:hypothetical protein